MEIQLFVKKDYISGFPGVPGVSICLSLSWPGIQSLVGDLRSCQACGMAKTNKQTEDCPFSIELLLHLCKNSAVSKKKLKNKNQLCTCVGLCLGPLFYSIDL